MPKRGQKLYIRQATPEDIPAINALVAKVYKDMGPYTPDQLRGQLNHYPKGHMVAIYEDTVVGYSASLRASERCPRACRAARACRRVRWASLTVVRRARCLRLRASLSRAQIASVRRGRRRRCIW